MDRKLPRVVRHALTYGFLALAATACSDAGPTEIPAPDRNLNVTTGATLLECPIDSTRFVQGTIGLLGGSLQLDGHSITLPFGAVLLPTTIKLTVPASNYVEVDITANGLENFEFSEAVNVVISYDRCTRSDLAKKTITAWHIDGSTKTLLEQMPSTDDRPNRRVIFSTDHLSEYSAATN